MRIPYLRIQGRMHFFENQQKEAPTASGIGGSDAPWPVVLNSRPEIAVSVEKVGFWAETLLLSNVGPNDDVNFLKEIIIINIVISIIIV